MILTIIYERFWVVFMTFSLFFPIILQAQIGGKQNFSFIKEPTNARLTALGGVNVTSGFGKDVNMITSNPALMTADVSGHASINYLPMFAGINLSSLSYSKNFQKKGAFGANLQYINYGSFEETDANGTVIGNFRASEYVFTLAHAHTIENYTIGLNLKFAGSNIANYSAYGLLADIGVVFKHPKQDLTIGLVIKNAGFTLKKYTSDSESSLPFDVQLGASFKPENMPLRFSLTARQLNQFDIAYNDPLLSNQVDLNGNQIQKKISFADKLLRHFVFGSELILSKNINFRFGYNYLIRKELRLENASGGSGFSFGLMVKVKTFEVNYSRQWYHISGAVNCIGLTIDTQSLIKKKN